MGGGATKHYYTIVGLCEERLSSLQILGCIVPLGFASGGVVIGSYTLTDEGRTLLDKFIEKEMKSRFPEETKPIISNEEDE